MLHTAFRLLAVTVLAFIVTPAFRISRLKEYPIFSGWWDAERMPVFLIVWFIILALCYFVD